ncbi:PerC family transcriptional regulator [Escherichia coli]|nr:PerC family transcriptional regulator [Escherichia coli]EFS7178410.1 PerC family transcriptional regulator [Escherichia coli]EGF1626058.1 PerC family transcriptional regulator [Escherichia coli]EIK8055542.1 PerC family transcriptional regulator [Escherichia coli]HCP1376258.1 PerC family transcriptional regulator [Escherichia coli]
MKISVRHGRLNKILVDEFLSTQKRTLEAVEDLIAQKLEVAGCWRRASARWLTVMGEADITDAQREWLLQRRKYCMDQIMVPRKVNSSE